jgi:hypothetical protein
MRRPTTAVPGMAAVFVRGESASPRRSSCGRVTADARGLSAGDGGAAASTGAAAARPPRACAVVAWASASPTARWSPCGSLGTSSSGRGAGRNGAGAGTSSADPVGALDSTPLEAAAADAGSAASENARVASAPTSCDARVGVCSRSGEASSRRPRSIPSVLRVSPELASTLVGLSTAPEPAPSSEATLADDPSSASLDVSSLAVVAPAEASLAAGSEPPEGGGSEAAGRAGRSWSGSTYPFGSEARRTPRCTCGAADSESPPGPIVPTESPSPTEAPRETPMEPRPTSVTA